MRKVLGLIDANYCTGRLGKLTAERPVAAVPIGARYRLLDFALSNMVNTGLRTVGIVTPHIYRPILDHLGAGKEWFLDRKVGGLFILPGSNYGSKSLTAKFLLKDMLKNTKYLQKGTEEYVIVSSANQIFNMTYDGALEAHETKSADITLIYKEEPEDTPKRDQGYYMKMVDEWVNALVPGSSLETGEKKCLFADCFIINRRLFLQLLDWYKNMEFSDMQDIIEENLGNLKVYGYGFSGYLKRIETIGDYYFGNMDFLRDSVRNELFLGEDQVLTKVKDNAPTLYTSESEVRNSLIASGCRIEGTVENSILFRKVIVEKGAVVKNSIIMQSGRVRRNSLVENVICDKHSCVEPEALLKGRITAPMVIGKESVV